MDYDAEEQLTTCVKRVIKLEAQLQERRTEMSENRKEEVGGELPHTPQDQFNAGGEQVKSNAEDAMDHFNMMPAEDELEWLRGQYVELRGMLDAARQGYADAGREAAGLRRALASRAPTVRERAAIEMMQALTSYTYPEKSFEWLAVEAVKAADALVAALNGVEA